MSQVPVATPSAASTVPLNQLSADVEIKGTVVFKNNLTAHGHIEGEVLTDGILTIGKTGTVDGDINAGSVSVQGSVNGNINVNARCELKGNAKLIGDLVAPVLVMEDGATFVGRANVSPNPQPDLIGRAGRRG